MKLLIIGPCCEALLGGNAYHEFCEYLITLGAGTQDSKYRI